MDGRFEQDPHTLSLDERLAALAAIEREIARLQARSARLVAAIVDDPRGDTPAPLLEKGYVREEVRTVLRESVVSVNNRIEFARTLTNRLPATLDAMEHGELTHRHAILLVDAITGLTDPDATEVEAVCLPFAAGRDTTAFARKVRREVLGLDSRTIEQRTMTALSERRVWTYPNTDGATATLGAVLPADGAQLLRTALDVAADSCAADDPRTKDQRRADALVQLGVDAMNRFRNCPGCRNAVVRDDNNDNNDNDNMNDNDGPPMTRWHGARPTIQVVVALSTLLGIDDQPGELSGHGPIPAELARHVAADESGTWRRLVTDEVGQVVDYGRTRYRPPADLRDYVLARDRTCTFPGCYRPACRCELDHAVAWADGGRTDKANIVAMCCRHHHVKHDTDWTVRANGDGSYTWTSPTGRRHTVDAAVFPSDRTLECAEVDPAALPRAG